MYNFSILLFFSALLTITNCVGIELDYSHFRSIEEVIDYETVQIANTSSDNYSTLIDIYFSRAESYLLLNMQNQALNDLEMGFKLAQYCNENECTFLFLRYLFDSAILYGLMDRMDDLYNSAASIQELLTYSMHEKRCENQNILPTFSKVNLTDRPILGPNKITIDECFEFVQGTSSKLRYLISLVPKAEAQVILHITIDGLHNEALRCCSAGGIWKACLQPLVNKWYNWNEKYKLLGIPPDPAWD